MGRIFETRKATMFARWDKMAKAFARVGKDIAIAVKAGGASVDSNPALRRAIQNGRAINMPKDKLENAIKRAAGEGGEAYEELLYEGYGPHGVAVLIETATDNPVRTVGNLRVYFKKYAGNLAASGSVGFMFTRMGVFKLDPKGVDEGALELDMIDFGLEEVGETTSDSGERRLVLRCGFQDFGQLQAGLESKGITPLSAESEYVANDLVTLPEDQATEVLALIDRLEQDDDVQRVFHNLG